MPAERVPNIARELGATDAEVAGVLSYYPDLRTSAPGRHVIRVCMGESCYANGCGRVLRELQERLRADVHETTPEDGSRSTRCPARKLCSVPTVIIDRDLYGRVLPSQLEKILERYT